MDLAAQLERLKTKAACTKGRRVPTSCARCADTGFVVDEQNVAARCACQLSRQPPVLPERRDLT